MEIKIKRMHEAAKMPAYAHVGDVGLDVYSREETYTLQPGEKKNFMVGFALEFPVGYAAIMKDRSSMARTFGMHVMGGVYDAGYRGEYNVELINLSGTAQTIEHQQKIAQLVFFPVAIPELTEVEELSDSTRGEGRFGSTGKF
jgi:dUTP pyrophosphatase